MNPFESIPGHPWLLALVEVLVLLVVRLHLDVDDLVEPLVRGEVPLDDLPVGDGGVGPGGEQEGPLVQLEVQVTLVLDVDVVVDDRREGDVLLGCNSIQFRKVSRKLSQKCPENPFKNYS